MKHYSLIRMIILSLMSGVLMCSKTAIAQVTDPFFQAGKIRVLILSGRNNHDWRTTTPFLRKTLVESGRFDVRVEEEPMGITQATLAAYDVLVLDYDGPRWGEATEKAVEDFVKSGKGLVAIHAASYAFTGLEVLGDNHRPMGLKEPPWPEYLKMIGGWWTEGPPKTAHAPRHCFTVKLVDRDHPITQGMKESFVVSDELYHSHRMSPEAHVLATAFDDPTNGGTGKDEPMIWTVDYGQGRTMYMALGHDVAAMQEPGFVNTLLRGTEWAATGAVTLPVDAGAVKAEPKPLRLLVVTGGHEYPTTFYTVFEGADDLHWIHAVSNHEAFRDDIRSKYDVLVLYDFSQDISETEKTHLRDFVESGKGIVVLHHAIADYQTWEWWYKEVVGGRYLLKAEGSMPASTYIHGEEQSVRVVAKHPITARLGTMHLWDETYKGMWISPDVQVLLRSDNPTSDGPVAWVSPYPKSRVVYIQLGHGETAHLYPAYRTLVHNAIRWSSGRLGEAMAPGTPSNLVDTLSPPAAKKNHTENRINGGNLVDDYRWLREKSNPEVAQYLEAENAYTDSIMKPTELLQKKLYDEMLSHIKETDMNVPYKEGENFYYSRWEAGKQYPILGRKRESLSAAEQITLDVNELAKGEKFMSLGAFEVSDDGNLLAYSTDNTGFRQYRLHVRDLRTGKDLSDTAEKTGSLVWASDSRTLFYTIEDHAKRQYRLYRHEVGDEARSDELVYEEKDERFNIRAERSRSHRFIFLTSGSHTTSEVRYLDAANPTGEWKLVAPREQDVEYYADHLVDHFYVRTNDKGRNFRLVSAPISDPGKKNWKEVVPVREDVMLSGFEAFQDFYVLFERERGLPQLTIVNLATGAKQRIHFPEPVYTASPQINREFKTKFFRYAYQSLLTPPSVFDYDVESHTSTLLKQNEVPGGYDPSKYKSERLWATARDGTQVPISVVYRKDLKKEDGSNALYVYGYGSYGMPLPVTFNSNRLSLLDRGFVMAFAHIRGGGDLGKPWHDAGRMMNKMNTFTDFVDCTEYLVANKYGARDKIVIEGGSAGGLLMGAATNLRPDLFKVVVAHVPFVDVMNTMLDASLPLTVPEYEEWGNPNEKPAYDYMLKYSPYDNLKKGPYPAMLVKTSFNDSQVMYWEPAKYVAKLRTLKTDNNALLLKTNMAAGHGGSSGRYDYLKEIAFDYAFMLAQVGLAG